MTSGRPAQDAMRGAGPEQRPQGRGPETSDSPATGGHPADRHPTVSSDLEALVHAATQAWRLSQAFENATRDGGRSPEHLARARGLLEEFWANHRGPSSGDCPEMLKL